MRGPIGDDPQRLPSNPLEQIAIILAEQAKVLKSLQVEQNYTRERLGDALAAMEEVNNERWSSLHNALQAMHEQIKSQNDLLQSVLKGATVQVMTKQEEEEKEPNKYGR